MWRKWFSDFSCNLCVCISAKDTVVKIDEKSTSGQRTTSTSDEYFNERSITKEGSLSRVNGDEEEEEEEEAETLRDWSELIDEILQKIWQQHIDSQLQTDVRRRMRAVCTSWRACVPLTTVNPNHHIYVPNSYEYEEEEEEEEEEEAETLRDWSDLIDEILQKIWQQHVDSQLQMDVRRRMRAVCTSWRACVPLTTVNPSHHVDVPNFYEYALPGKGLYLIENTFYLITPLANPKLAWLVRAEERGPNLFRARNPYYGIYCLFYLFNPSSTTSKIDNLLDYQIRELHRTYTLKSSHRNHPHKIFDIDPPQVSPFRKILTSEIKVNDHSTVFTAFVLSFTGFICFWRAGDTEWTKLTKFDDKAKKDHLVETEGDEIGMDNEFSLFIDIALYKGKYYAIEMKTGDVYIIDPLSIAANAVKPFTVQLKLCFSQGQTRVTRFGINRECHLSNCSLFEYKGLLYYFIHVRHPRSNQCEANSLFVLKGKTGSSWESVDPLSEMAHQVIFMLGEASFVIPQTDGVWDAGIFTALYYVPEKLAYNNYQVRLPFKGCFTRCAFRKTEADVDDEDDALSLSRNDECTSIFFPPPWLKS